MREGYVEYLRATDLNTRSITAAEWTTVGVEDQNTLIWGPSNNWRIPADEISDAAWPHIENDNGLRHVVPEKQEADDAGTEVSEPEVRGTDKPKRKPRNG